MVGGREVTTYMCLCGCVFVWGYVTLSFSPPRRENYIQFTILNRELQTIHVFDYGLHMEFFRCPLSDLPSPFSDVTFVQSNFRLLSIHYERPTSHCIHSTRRTSGKFTMMSSDGSSKYTGVISLPGNLRVPSPDFLPSIHLTLPDALLS